MTLEAHLSAGASLSTRHIALLTFTFVIDVLVPVATYQGNISALIEHIVVNFPILDILEVIDEAFHGVHGASMPSNIRHHPVTNMLVQNPVTERVHANVTIAFPKDDI